MDVHHAYEIAQILSSTPIHHAALTTSVGAAGGRDQSCRIREAQSRPPAAPTAGASSRIPHSSFRIPH